MSRFGQRSDNVHKGGELLQLTGKWAATHHHNDMRSSVVRCSPPAPSASSMLSTTPSNQDLINHEEALGPECMYVCMMPLFTCRGEKSVSRHRVETGAGRTPIRLTVTCLQVFTAPLMEITCFECSKFKFSTTDENKWQNSSHSMRLHSCIKTSRAFKYYPPDIYKDPHQRG